MNTGIEKFAVEFCYNLDIVQRGLPAGSARPRTIVGLGIVGNFLAVELNREIKR